MLEAVLQTLDQQIEVHRKLLDLSEQKKHAIVRNEIDSLMQVTQKETKLAKQAEELEAARIEAVNAFMRSKNMFVTAAITIGTLIRFVTRAEDKQALAVRRDELVRLTGHLKEANELNRQLLEQSLAYIDYSINLLVGPDQEAVYHPPQLEQHAYTANRVFDWKA